MSTEVTPDLLLLVAAAWEGSTASDDYARNELRGRADWLEHQQRPLPTVPGWYPTVVVERGGESCTGALLTPDCLWWCTPAFLDDNFLHRNSDETTIRWAEQDGTTAGQTLWDVSAEKFGDATFDQWSDITSAWKAWFESTAAAVLAAHGTPTLTEWGCPSCGETTRARMADQPPETVESLRAERDAALTNARTWEDLADGWRDRAIELRGDVREANDTIARLRATHTAAEIAWGRCQRED